MCSVFERNVSFFLQICSSVQALLFPSSGILLLSIPLRSSIFSHFHYERKYSQETLEVQSILKRWLEWLPRRQYKRQRRITVLILQKELRWQLPCFLGTVRFKNFWHVRFPKCQKFLHRGQKRGFLKCQKFLTYRKFLTFNSCFR